MQIWMKARQLGQAVVDYTFKVTSPANHLYTDRSAN